MGRSGETYGAEMRRFACTCAVLLFAICATSQALAEDAVDFVKSVIPDPSAETWAFVTYPDNHLEVVFNLQRSSSNAGIIASFSSLTKKIVPTAFEKFPKIQAIHIVGNLPFTDKRGNDQTAIAIVVQFSRKNSASIRWEKVQLTNVIDIADHHSINPTLTK
jgi:hypothetical protein